MSYIENNLLEGETILYRAYLHWIVFIWPMFWFFIAIIFLSGGSYLNIIGGLFMLFAISTGIISFINYKTSEFGITNKRVVVKVGFIRRESLEVLLNKVEGIQVDQGIMGRILGFGSIVISGTGGTKDPLHKISAPLEFRRRAQEQISLVQDSK